MTEIVLSTFMYLAAVVALALVFIAWAVMMFALTRENDELFQEFFQRRADKKLFKKIEEYRNDFA